MSGKLVFPGPIPPSSLVSATSQGGAVRKSIATEGVENAGSLIFDVSGDTGSSGDVRFDIVDGGAIKTATYKISRDGGSTFLGRKADTTWDENGGGEIAIFDSDSALSTSMKPTEIILVDTDGDGVKDTAFVVVVGYYNPASYRAGLYKTTDLETGTGWTQVSYWGVNTSGDASLVEWNGVLYFFLCSFGGSLQSKRSYDFGVNWTVLSNIESLGGEPTLHFGASACVLSSGKLALAYSKLDTDKKIYIKTTSDGVTWSAAKEVAATGGVDYWYPTMVQDANGKTIIFYYRSTATAAINAKQCTDIDPSATGATWAAYSETLPAMPGENSAVIADDGTIYLVNGGAAGVVYFSKLKGAGTFSAPATAYDSPDDISHARIGNIGGALWCAFVNNTDYSVQLVMTKYWTAYDGTTAPASWTGLIQQCLVDGITVEISGGTGVVGDSYSSLVVTEYGASRMLAMRPSHPSRSLADGAAWSCVFDLGANVLVPIDTILMQSNVDHLHFQMNDSDSWTSPSVNTTVNFVKETIADAGHTVAAGKVTRLAGAWVPGTLAGYRARIGTLAAGAVYEIRDNDATALYIDADLSALTGDLVIYSPAAWVAQTKAAYRYIRILIDAQETAEGYYEIPVLFAGMAVALDEISRARPGWEAPDEDAATRGGNIYRTRPGVPRREYSLALLDLSVEQYQEIVAKLNALGSKPLAYIDDTTNALDWALCYPPSSSRWLKSRTELLLTESI